MERLIIAVVSNAALTALIYLAQKYTAFKKLPHMLEQLIIGVVFGMLAVYSSENGILYERYIVNVRDAAVMNAGLIFGAPAGIISGIISGINRIFFEASDLTQIAGAICTVFVGVVAAISRKLMFDDKKPTWAYGVGLACVCEDVYMLLIFLLNFNDSSTAFLVVQSSTIPLCIGNAATVALAIIIVTVLSGEKLFKRKKNTRIAQKFQQGLFICICIAYLFTSWFTFRLQSNMAEKQASDDIIQTINEIHQDILDASDTNLLSIANDIKEDYCSYGWSLSWLAAYYEVSDINIFGKDGIVTKSNHSYLIGYDMNSGEQSSEFMCLFDGKTEYVQEFQPSSFDSRIKRKYAAVLLPDGNAIQVGYSYKKYKSDIDEKISNEFKNRHIGENGYILIADKDQNIIGVTVNDKPVTLSDLSIDIHETKTDTIYRTSESNLQYFYSYLYVEDYYIVGLLPVSEAYYMRDVTVYVSLIVEIIIFASLFLLVYFLIKKVIINNLHRINSSLAKIAEGDLNITVNVRSNAEFSSLSDDINTTVDTLKKYIQEAETRIDKELEYAKEIQLSSLPSVFPPYPDKKSFDIYAGMYTAKEVGGDFYDFYMLDENNIAFLIADVSGKGIPAALFMMTAKTTIRDLAERGLGVDEILTQANNKLCKGNDAGMFVTAFIAIMNLKTGVIRYSNAGHNPPLVLRKNGTFEYVKVKAGLVLAGMEGMKYRVNEAVLEPGERILLYTDGVTEATNQDEKLYGEDRLYNFVNSHKDQNAKELVQSLKQDIDDFVGEAPQFDDITMLMFDYFGNTPVKVREFPAKLEELGKVQKFFDEELEKAGCDAKKQLSISIAIEEVFANIAQYAYPNGEGSVTAEFSFDPAENIAKFRFRDKGMPFDPLKKMDPDITLNADERKVGGLGIFIVKKTMDSLDYRYVKGVNILTMTKKLK